MTAHTHPDPHHAPAADPAAPAAAAEPTTGKANDVTVTTVTTVSASAPKAKPTEANATATATTEPEKKGMSPWAIAGAVGLGLLLLGLLGGMYWLGNHNSTPATPAAIAGCCPQVIAGIVPTTSPCCPQPLVPPPAPVVKKMTVGECVAQAVAGMEVAHEDDRIAAVDGAREECEQEYGK